MTIFDIGHTLQSLVMGRKPKDAKKITLKFDRAIYDQLRAVCESGKIKITHAIEQGAVLWLKRRKSKAKAKAR